MPRFIVERTFEPPLTPEDLHGVEGRMAPCLELYRVQWLRSYWSEDRRRMVCEYEAADAASVRDVQREAGATFDRVWPAELLGGGDAALNVG
ncbi:DUF4242 domain-containing protein [Paeniroseomonas aquatica]|jgi:hypothetical protein|uniref:DUF4242 domain-containing protein n=1 Tax=Paeniroseomonas aquatica TaxID=373043 RepID=A0ABT8A039_9PROT|nr:DUF4242 domain-containing protein [Paeniroseomonas aquatica]MDN3562981.1 DUF4242 domain-containing protein [Paeniroseomonas aquatica]